MMKNKILLILSMSICFISNAQDFGLKGGLNFSSYIDSNDTDISADYNGKLGFFIGGFISYDLNEKIALRPELLYSVQGAKFNIGLENFNFASETDAIFNTPRGKIREILILLPIIFQYELEKKLTLDFGPQLGYSIKREIDPDDEGTYHGYLKNTNDEKFELGFGLGLSYYFSENYSLNIRYNYGIIERQNLNTSVIQLGVNYQF